MLQEDIPNSGQNGGEDSGEELSYEELSYREGQIIEEAQGVVNEGREHLQKEPPNGSADTPNQSKEEDTEPDQTGGDSQE